MGAGGTTTRGHGADFLAEVERNKNPAGVFLVSPFSLEICSCAGFTVVAGGAFSLCWEHVELAFRLHHVRCLEVYTRPPSWAGRGLQAQKEGLVAQNHTVLEQRWCLSTCARTTGIYLGPPGWQGTHLVKAGARLVEEESEF